MSDIQGGCLCGDVSIALPKDLPVAICHCISCRKTSGAVASYNFIADPEKMTVKGAPKFFDDMGQNGPTKRYFCGKCGSTLYTSINAPQPVFVKAGLFEPQDITQKPSLEFFCKNLESWNEPFKGTDTKDTQ